ncbi:MAG: PEGA domain-containing protein [Bacteroidetes bacterium]|nr:PEGA domain-containing protein [Bacteroidota bacterium]
MDRIFLTLLLSFTAFSFLFSQEFEVRSFRSDALDISAIRYPRKDVSNQPAAIIKVRTNLDEIKFESNMGLVGDPLIQEGEIWLYVSPREKRLKFMKEGFVTIDYIIKQVIESSSVYILELIKTGDVVEEKVVITQPPPVIPPDNKSYGYILIQSEPSGAEVLIDGKKTGVKTPFQKPYSPGKYSFSLRKELFKDYSGSFNVDPNETTRLTIKFSPNFGTLKITSEPEDGATIVLDEKVLNISTPAVIDSLAKGNYSLSIRKDFYESQKFTVSIEPGKTKSIKCDLQPTFGTIEVEALEGSEIFIDKEKVGTTTYSGRILGGVHILEVRKEKHYDYSETISVEVGKPYKLKPKLDPKVGVLSIMSDPPEASIYLDNEYKGKAPLIIRDIIVGSHILKISKPSFGEITKTIKIEENKSTECKENLASTSKVKIVSRPSKGTLKINGNTVGETPHKQKLSFGNHTIEINKEKYDRFSKNITVTQKNQTFKYQLLKTRRYQFQIRSKPSRAKVTIDGVKRGRTPIRIPVSYGSHSIKLSKRRHNDVYRKYYVRNLKEKQHYQLGKQIKYRNKGRMAISIVSGYIFPEIEDLHPNYGKKPGGWAQLIDIKLFTRNYKVSFNLTPGFFRFWSNRSEDLLMIPLFLSFDFYIFQVDVRRIGWFIGLGFGGLVSVENQLVYSPPYLKITKAYSIWTGGWGMTARVGISIKISPLIRLELGSYPYLLYSGNNINPGNLIIINAGVRVNL